MEPYATLVKRHAHRFRAAVDSAKQAGDLDPHPGFRDFPLGSCGVATAMLCTYFHAQDLPGWQYVCGRKEQPFKTHAWAVRDGLIVDITADQFPEHTTVYVGPATAWHEAWTSEGPPRNHSADPNDGYLDGPAYQAILRHLT